MLSRTKNPDKRKRPVMQSCSLWLKANLFSTPLNSMVSLILIGLFFKCLGPLFDWLFVNSIWEGTAQTCRQGDGACLVFIREKFQFIIFGFYPRELLWRPSLAMITFIGCCYYSSRPRNWNKKVFYIWPIIIVWCGLLMRGGFGLEYVPLDKWGGLPLTLILSFFGIISSYPIGILLALGRRSHLPFIRSLSIAYIELIRGIPMISLLFMASVLFPLFLPQGVVFPKLLRAQIAIIMFMSAYMAEVIRGGLASLPQGQYEAADSLGLNYWQKYTRIILPQALRIVIPPTVNTVIGMFKDTSLVVIVALSDLLMTTKTSLRDPQWLGFSVEAYLFVAIIYFIFCFSMSRYSSKLEEEFNYGAR